MKSPFIKHESRWYVVLGWEKGIEPGTTLRLRPLSDDESRQLEDYRENFDAEAWAMIMGKDQ